MDSKLLIVVDRNTNLGAAIVAREAELGRPLKKLADLAPTAQDLKALIDWGRRW